MASVLIVGGILCAWAMLSLLGGERSRRLMEIEGELKVREQAEVENRFQVKGDVMVVEDPPSPKPSSKQAVN